MHRIPGSMLRPLQWFTSLNPHNYSVKYNGNYSSATEKTKNRMINN